MQFYVISPLKHTELMLQGTAGVFCLAHLYIKNKEYRDFILDCKTQGINVLTDNGAAENSLITQDILIDIVKELRPDIVVSPDVLFDCEKTIENVANFAMAMYRCGNEIYTNTKIMGVPQGKNAQEWTKCYSYMLKTPYVNMIGFSKIATPYCFLGATKDEKIMESRQLIYSVLRETGNIRKPIHLLGAGDMREFSFYKDCDQIVSTDSCNSVWSAINGISYQDGDFRRIPTPHDYFEREMTQEQIDLFYKNVAWMKENI